MSQMPTYDVEPKYDSVATQAFRNGSMPEYNPLAMEGAWAQRQASPHSPHPSQHYYTSPSHSPRPPATTPVRADPSELNAARPGMPSYSQGSYMGRKPGTPSSERQYQYQ